jgi:hypothetical protein
LDQRSRDYARALLILIGTKFDGWLITRSPAPLTCLVFTNMPPNNAKDIIACWSLRFLSFILSAFLSLNEKERHACFLGLSPCEVSSCQCVLYIPTVVKVNPF